VKNLADEGMAEVPGTFALGGVEAHGDIRRDAVLNLVTLRDTVAIIKNSQGEVDTGKSREATWKLQRYLLGLALVSLTWFDGKALNLRQGCQLVGLPEKPLTRCYVNADGAEIPFDLDKQMALDYAKEAAEEFGVVAGYEGVFEAKKAKDALKKSAAEEAE
jgi:hypothetical protein